MIEVELPDGTIVEFPEGTSQEVMRQALQSLSQRAAPEQQPAAEEPSQSAAAAFAGNILPGLTFGFADEMAAGIGSVFEDRSYEEILQGLRTQQDLQEQEHPVSSVAGQITGGAVPVLFGGGMALGAGKTLAGKAGIGAGVGAVEGGLAGFGAGEGGLANRGASAARGAAIGGVVGGLAPVAVAGARVAGNAVANPIASALNIPSEVRAGRALETYLQRAGMTADDVAARTAQAAQEGQPMYVAADAMGNAGQRALSGVARQPGDARQIIADMLTRRQDGQGGRLAGFVTEGLDAPDTAAQRTASLTAARRAAADTAYTAARGNAAPVDIRAAVAAIDGRVAPMRGMGVTLDGIDKKLEDFRNRLMARNLKAPDAAVELSDFDRVLGVKQDVGDAIGEAVRAGRANEARELGKLQVQLDAALEGASDMYRTANDDFARASRVIDTVDEGAAATSGRMRAENTVPRYQGMPADQQAAFRAGYADPTIARIDSAAPGVNKARPLRNDKVSAELGAMAKDPALLSRRIDRENTMFETANSALGGSKTADNLADAADTQSMSASVIGNLLQGNLAGAGSQALTNFMSGATGSNPATREIIARMLMAQDPRAMLAPAKRAARRNDNVSAVIEALIRSAERATAQ